MILRSKYSSRKRKNLFKVLLFKSYMSYLNVLRPRQNSISTMNENKNTKIFQFSSKLHPSFTFAFSFKSVSFSLPNRFVESERGSSLAEYSIFFVLFFFFFLLFFVFRGDVWYVQTWCGLVQKLTIMTCPAHTNSTVMNEPKSCHFSLVFFSEEEKKFNQT